MWQALCRVLDGEALIGDPRFATPADRSANRTLLWPVLEHLFLARTADEWMRALDEAGVPVGVVNTLDRVVADPQIAHRGMVIELTSEDGRRVAGDGRPVLPGRSRGARGTPFLPQPASIRRPSWAKCSVSVVMRSRR